MDEPSLNPAPDLTVHRFEGPVTREALRQVLSAFYAGTPTPLVLWDGRNADLSPLHSVDVDELSSWTLPFSEKRRGGRSAIVVTGDVNYGVARMMQSYVEARQFPFAINCFHDIDSAMQWLRAPGEGKRLGP